MDTSMRGDRLAEDLAAVSCLADPVRQSLYAYIAAQPGPVTREDAAKATDVSRTLAAYHLDKLSDAGLLEVGYARPGGRSGPGAGRPAKTYRRAEQDVSVTLPSRSYVVMADVLATALAADETGAVRAAAARAANSMGRSAGHDDVDLFTALRKAGYEPVSTPEGEIELRNCPFHQLAAAHTELVCGLNLDLVEGVLQGVGQPGSRAELRPRPGQCCVVIRATA